MREFLLQFMGEDAAMGVQFLVALLAVLILFGIFIWFLRLLTGTSKRTRRISNDHRLAVLDRTQIDENRSLLLVRRDDVEHLVMVGGPSDVVVESNINLDEEDELDGFASQQPGHEIARRVIAQRPLRTMSLASSSPSVAESMGLDISSRPDATIAPPPPPLPVQEEPEQSTPTATPKAVAEPEPVQIAEIPPVEVPPQPVAATAQPVAPTPVSVVAAPAETAAISQPAPQPMPAPAAQPHLVENTAPEPVSPLAPIAPEPIVQATVTPTAAPAADPQIQVHTQAPRAAQMPDLAAQLEDALNLELSQDTHHKSSTQSNGGDSTHASRGSSQQNISTGEPTMDDQEFSQRQEADLSAGFEAAMALDISAEPISTPSARPAPAPISEVALEDAIADMLLGDTAADTSTYNNGKNAVYSSSESVPSGSERLVDTTRPGRVDDEMSRLLQELAVPGRA